MCIFCEIVNGNIPASKIYEDDSYLAFLDLSQSTPGHTLLVPKKHMKNLLDADHETLSTMLIIAQDVGKMLMEKLGADGINIISNANEVSGQTVDHFHLHIVPRYQSDELEFKFKPHVYTLDETFNKLK